MSNTRHIEKEKSASIRISPGGYLLTAGVLTFIAFVFLQAGKDFAGLLILLCAWLFIPVLAFTERLRFDGRVLIRQGFIAFIHRLSKGRPLELAINDIERIETSALRTLRRGGRVRYRYRSEVSGNSLRFVFASGGKNYRRFARELFSLVNEDKVDARTTELRDYLVDANSLRTTLGLLHVAPASVLDSATQDYTLKGKNKLRQRRAASSSETISIDELERGKMLRRAGNELRTAGRLREAAEAFRRAMLAMPRDAGLIYETARLLRSQASMMNDARLLQRARAGLWLAAQRSKSDAGLLSRIGESFIETGDYRRAERSFQRALALNPNAYRAELGLADVALRSGKLAHVVHHYNGAARVAKDRATTRFAAREADYYAQLNSDDGYLAIELRRIGWLQNLHYTRRVAARVTFTGIVIALIGAILDDSLRVVGWSLASSSILAWSCAAIAEKFFTRRRQARPAE
jgi:tetratricopeptide (TPR) repeat protein